MLTCIDVKFIFDSVSLGLFEYTTLADWSFLILGGPTDAGWYRPFFVNLQPSYVASFAWVHLQVFTEILWCPFFGNKQGRSYDTPSLCQFTDIKNIRITRLFVCARLIDQFTKIYDPPFGSIYRELWWPICNNLQGVFNPLVVLQIEDLRPGCINFPKQILFKSSLYILLTDFFLLHRSHPIRQLNCIKCMWNEYTNIFVSKQVKAAGL